jgi:hypothetical protein
MKEDSLQKLIENTAAISAEFHLDARYQAAYDKHGESVSGFTGLWALCGDAAHVVTKAEQKGDIDFMDMEWIEFIDNFVELMHRYLAEHDDAPQDREFWKMVESAKIRCEDQKAEES